MDFSMFFFEFSSNLCCFETIFLIDFFLCDSSFADLYFLNKEFCILIRDIFRPAVHSSLSKDFAKAQTRPSPQTTRPTPLCQRPIRRIRVDQKLTNTTKNHRSPQDQTKEVLPTSRHRRINTPQTKIQEISASFSYLLKKIHTLLKRYIHYWKDTLIIEGIHTLLKKYMHCTTLALGVD